MEPYEPSMSAQRVEHLRQWHEDASAELHQRGPADVEYLGLDLHVPPMVFPPTPTSDLLGEQVLTRVQPTHRVLDMGCGAGANAILAARRGARVVAVDINPAAVSATIDNAARNGVAERVEAFESDVFSNVDGTFDVIVFDPPFRWFAPGDLLDRAITDENYATLRGFMAGAPERLRPGGEVLLFYGSSGDVAHLDDAIGRCGLTSAVIAERTIPVRGETATYFVRRLTA